ncbi:AAA family ATPase [Lacibacterium aquatile]|uniref:AAA family ATPase n=1 Tax=Lacibacterium aquatile TaxID=1168082 RepID=A0ABW5DQK0_9PROT
MTEPIPPIFWLYLEHPAKHTVPVLQELKQLVIELTDKSIPAPANRRRENKPQFFIGRVTSTPELEYEFETATTLLAAQCGDQRSMVAIGSELFRHARENPENPNVETYLKLAREWTRLGRDPDFQNFDPSSEFPARKAIQSAFYRFADEQEMATIVRPEPEEPEVEIYSTLRMRVLLEPTTDKLLKALAGELPLIPAPNPSILRQRLQTEFPWAEAAIDTMVKAVILAHARDSVMWMRPMLLVGEPGCGKTRLCQRFAEWSGVPNRTLSFAGMSDARLMLGTARGWHNATPSYPLDLILRSGIANPLLIIDEIEKAQRGHISGNGGDVQAAMLNFIERESASRFVDGYAASPVDLSRITWMATANSLEGLSAALLSRMTVIPFPSPTAEHFDALIELLTADLPGHLEPEAIEFLRSEFAKGRVSIRDLKRAIEAALACVPQTISTLLN